MDAGVIYGAIGAAITVGSVIVVVAVYASTTRAMAESTASDLTDVAHKTRNLENWRLNILPNDLNANYARKDTITAELTGIKEMLKRIEQHQDKLSERLMGGGA